MQDLGPPTITVLKVKNYPVRAKNPDNSTCYRNGINVCIFVYIGTVLELYVCLRTHPLCVYWLCIIRNNIIVL